MAFPVDIVHHDEADTQQVAWPPRHSLWGASGSFWEPLEVLAGVWGPLKASGGSCDFQGAFESLRELLEASRNC